ncbi:MAG: alpha/beta hydrolase [Lachnospiraceae bacterium]|nr:alpha/beta hydrolase [Lachnospiraceae bacterium]
MPYITTNDRVRIYYKEKGSGRALLLLPGWTCSTRFWDKNFDALADHFHVIAMDMRAHGESEKVMHSHRISRYAMDVKNLLDELGLEDVTVLGWSMGASVLWSYLELFGRHRVSGLICVDQSPAQYTGPDWKWGQKSCYDAEMFVRTCCQVQYDPRGASEGLVSACSLGERTADEIKILADEIDKCPPYCRIEIMRDHTNLDWRDFIPTIRIPTLVCVARQSAVFDWHGSAWVGENIPGAQIVFFENAGHMLFWEEPEKFNEVVTEFVENHPSD